MDKLKTICVRGHTRPRSNIRVGDYTRLRCNTLVEAIVALTVISILFGIATTYCVRLTTGTESLKKIRAANLLQMYADRTIADQAFFDAASPAGEFRVSREIEDTAAGPGNLIRIHFSVVDSNKVVLGGWDQLVKDER